MPSVQLLFGPMLIGVFLNTILYGVMVVQMFIYFQTYKKDAAWIRYFVLYLFIIETVNTGCNIFLMYQPLVLKYGTPDATTYFPTMLAAEPIVTTLISTPIQIFIAWRIRIISRVNWIAAFIVIFALISLGGGAWTGATVVIIKRFIRKPELHWPALTWLLASAVADAIITSSLVFSLSRRRTGFSGTDDAINRIIRLTVQTGLITAIFAALDVICFLVVPHTTLNFVWDFALSKLYTNALISTLNARAGWDNLANAHTNDNILFGDITVSGVSTSRRGGETYQTTTRFHATNDLGNSGVYELDTPSSAHSRAKSVEFGISITKQVDRIEDPLPVHHSTQ
ncbi:hypothetical protein HGRIS_000620 [Hohenbuehelia grisea]|uniref:DUF6534 domain-containing protein n=1 Tax=Hohenbuehelia grisea TaxID=104357 RepID=A0ABR3JTL2_9AGAR